MGQENIEYLELEYLNVRDSLIFAVLERSPHVMRLHEELKKVREAYHRVKYPSSYYTI